VEDKLAYTITQEEFEQMQLEHQQKIRDILIDLVKKEEWEKFVDTAICYPEAYPFSFIWFDKVPSELKRKFAVAAYSHHGDSIPCVRKAIRSLSKCEAPKLPKKLADKEVITVYRAGEEDITKCKYRISWTTNKKVALFFLNTWQGKHATHLYEAKIKTKDILAHTNDRKENEILQYRKVFDITEITERQC